MIVSQIYDETYVLWISLPLDISVYEFKLKLLLGLWKEIE